MAKKNMTLRMEPGLKAQVSALFKSLGLDFKHGNKDFLQTGAPS